MRKIHACKLLQSCNFTFTFCRTYRLSPKPRSFERWISKGILKSIQTKNALFKKCYKKNDALLIERYKKYTNRLTAVKRLSKQNYYASMIEKNKKDLSKQWKLINEILQRGGKNKPPLNKLVTEKNEILTDREDISNELNTFFANIGPNMASKIRTLKDNSKTNDLRNIISSSNSFFFFFEPCSESEIFCEIMHLNDKKATGIENMLVKVIKMTAEYI